MIFWGFVFTFYTIIYHYRIVRNKLIFKWKIPALSFQNIWLFWTVPLIVSFSYKNTSANIAWICEGFWLWLPLTVPSKFSQPSPINFIALYSASPNPPASSFASVAFFTATFPKVLGKKGFLSLPVSRCCVFSGWWTRYDANRFRKLALALAVANNRCPAGSVWNARSALGRFAKPSSPPHRHAATFSVAFEVCMLKARSGGGSAELWEVSVWVTFGVS